MNTFVTNGQAGRDVIDDTSTHGGLLTTCVKAIGGDVEFDTCVGDFPAGVFDGVTLSDGDFLPGVFTSIKLASGTLVLFK